MTADKLTGARRAARDLLGQPAETDEDLLARDRAWARVAKRARESRRVIKALEKELGEYQDRLAHLDSLAEAPDPEPYSVTAKRRKRGVPNAAYVMLASDWHMGERVRPETVGNRNEYNPDIAQERAQQFFESNLTMLNAARSAWRIDTGVLWLGGDLMTGYIHEEYEEDNFLSPVEESLLVFRTLNAGFRYLLDKSDLETILVPTSHGNHGRTGKKLRISTSQRNSYEWQLYRFLEEHWKNEPRLKFQVANGYHNVVSIFDRRIRFHHGDQVGYQGGIGGLSIPVNKRIGRQAKADAEQVYLDCLGHFHSLQFPKDFIVNGSLIGWNAYAEAKGFGYEEPMQASFVIDDRYGLVSNFNPILVKPHA